MKRLSLATVALALACERPSPTGAEALRPAFDFINGPAAPAWSPDGSRIAFMCRRGGPDFELCVMNADGSAQVQITNNSVFEGTPVWSPDGAHILLLAGCGPRPAAAVRDESGRLRRRAAHQHGWNNPACEMGCGACEAERAMNQRLRSAL